MLVQWRPLLLPSPAGILVIAASDELIFCIAAAFAYLLFTSAIATAFVTYSIAFTELAVTKMESTEVVIFVVATTSGASEDDKSGPSLPSWSTSQYFDGFPHAAARRQTKTEASSSTAVLLEIQTCRSIGFIDDEDEETGIAAEEGSLAGINSLDGRSTGNGNATGALIIGFKGMESWPLLRLLTVLPAISFCHASSGCSIWRMRRNLFVRSSFCLKIDANLTASQVVALACALITVSSACRRCRSCLKCASQRSRERQSLADR